MFVQIVVGLNVVGAACDKRLTPTRRRKTAEKKTMGETRRVCRANMLLVEAMIEITRRREGVRQISTVEKNFKFYTFDTFLSRIVS